MIDELGKRARERVIVFLFFLAAWLLVDEYVKEGYFFDPSDVSKPLTHEFLIVTSLVTAILAILYRVIRSIR